jgi:microcystin-dependent protein
MPANISKKSEAIGYLTTNINNSSDSYLNPTSTDAIKSGNLQAYLNRFIEWIFPGTPIDVRGKVLGVPSYDISGAPNTDYSGLEWLTMMPLGGIAMYAVNGINKNMGGGVFKAMINTVDPLNAILQNYNKELDGFLFCNGQVINVTIEENKKYKELQKLLNGYYGNDINSMSEITTGVYKKDLLYLPNMNGRVPLGFVVTQDGVYIEDVSLFKDKVNYGKTGNVGGKSNHKLEKNEMPIHTHGDNAGNTDRANTIISYPNPFATDKTYTSGISTDNSIGEINLRFPTTLRDTGGDQSHENRQPYMVLSYIIKY